MVSGQRLPLLAGLLVIVAACGADSADVAEEPRTLRTDSAGVEIVRNFGPDVPLAWRAVQVLALDGSQSGTPLAGAFPAGVDADARGRLYILDFQNRRVLVYDSAGTLQRTIGREGGGPGEFRRPMGLSAAPGVLYVMDGQKLAILPFSADGSPLPELRLSGRPAGALEVSDSGARYVLRSTEGQRLLLAGSSDTTVLASSPPTETGEIHLESCDMGFRGLFRILAPDIAWAGSGMWTAATDDVPYTIDVFEGASLRRVIRRDLPPRPITAEMAAAQIGEEGMKVVVSGGRRVCETAEVVEKRGFAPELQAVENVAITPRGALWVERGHVRGKAAPIDVFDSTGAYVGTLPPEFPFPAAFLPGDRFAGVQVDELGVTRVIVYRIEREPGERS